MNDPSTAPQRAGMRLSTAGCGRTDFNPRRVSHEVAVSSFWTFPNATDLARRFGLAPLRPSGLQSARNDVVQSTPLPFSGRFLGSATVSLASSRLANPIQARTDECLLIVSRRRFKLAVFGSAEKRSKEFQRGDYVQPSENSAAASEGSPRRHALKGKGASE
jgi:hypothetical protein